MATATAFHLDFYRFNGKGILPSLVSSADQAHFMRTRYSIDEAQIPVVMERVSKWGKANAIPVTSKPPYPSSQDGKFWLEFQIGGLIL
jgi:hypothetical protein